MGSIIKQGDIESKIIELREQNVMIDNDLALLYGVQTKEINQAVKNNPDKFPEGYVFEITVEEKKELVKIFDHLNKLKFSSQLPKAFTEKGLYMLATILSSKQATQTTLTIIETFSKFKSLSRNIKKISEVKDEDKKQQLMQKSGKLITAILDDDLVTNDTETSFELNFAVLKFKHTVTRKKKNDE